MAIASLVLGIISILIAIIPLCSVFCFVPAIVGIILGIVALCKKPAEAVEGEEVKPQGKGLAIAGTICNGLAIVIFVGWTMITAMLVKEVGNEITKVAENYDEEAMQDYLDQLEALDESGALDGLEDELENADSLSDLANVFTKVANAVDEANK